MFLQTFCSPGAVNTSKPSALKMLRPKSGRHNTISVAVPASIVENAQGGELKALLVGQMARALTIYGVDEVGEISVAWLVWVAQKNNIQSEEAESVFQ